MRCIGGRARRRSAGVALTFAVAAAASVAGGKLTGKITLAWMVFAALVIVGTLVTYWLDREAGENQSEKGEMTEDKSVQKDLRGAQGVQLGHSNVQNNYFKASADD